MTPGWHCWTCLPGDSLPLSPSGRWGSEGHLWKELLISRKHRHNSNPGIRKLRLPTKLVARHWNVAAEKHVCKRWVKQFSIIRGSAPSSGSILQMTYSKRNVRGGDTQIGLSTIKMGRKHPRWREEWVQRQEAGEYDSVSRNWELSGFCSTCGQQPARRLQTEQQPCLKETTMLCRRRSLQSALGKCFSTWRL